MCGARYTHTGQIFRPRRSQPVISMLLLKSFSLWGPRSRRAHDGRQHKPCDAHRQEQTSQYGTKKKLKWSRVTSHQC